MDFKFTQIITIGEVDYKDGDKVKIECKNGEVFIGRFEYEDTLEAQGCAVTIMSESADESLTIQDDNIQAISKFSNIN